MTTLLGALRTVAKEGAATGVAVLTLGLGVGVSSAVFTLVNSSVLRPLPVAEPDRLARLFLGSQAWEDWTSPVWEAMEQRSRGVFAGAFASSRTTFTITASDEGRFIEGLWASGGFFDTLGVQPMLGRVFADGDDRYGCGPDGLVVVISHRLHQAYFGDGAHAIGRPLPLDGVVFTVIGVMPSSFFGPTVGRTFDAVVPLGCEPIVRGRRTQLGSPWNAWLNITVRLRPEQAFAEATAMVQTWQPAIRDATMPEELTAAGRGRYLRDPMLLLPAGTGGVSTLWQRHRSTLLVLLGVSGLLLLVTCASIAHLMLARGMARQQTLALRVALGATPWHVARLVLVESVLLAAAAGTAGLLVAGGMTRLLVLGLSQQSGEVFVDVSVDWRVVGFTLLVSLGVALLFGTAPAVCAARSDPRAALVERERLLYAKSGIGLERVILVGQVAVSLALVVVAGLFVRTFSALAERDAGVDRDRVLLVTPHAFGEAAAIPSPQQLRRYERIREAVRAIPGVSHVAVSFPTPVSPNAWRVTLDAVLAPDIGEAERRVDATVVSPDWFATYGVPLLRGRDFTDDDLVTARSVAIVNDAFVQRFLGNDGDPLGSTVVVTHEPERRYAVVGVVGNVAPSLRGAVRPALYIPLGRDGRIENIRGSLEMGAALLRRRSAEGRWGSATSMARAT